MAITRKKTWQPRERLTAEDLNGEIDNIINNLQAKNCAGCGEEESQVLATTPPDIKSPPRTIEDELKWLRHKIREITGQARWYDPGGFAPTGIAGMHRGLVVERTEQSITMRADSLVMESPHSQRQVDRVDTTVGTDALGSIQENQWARLFLVAEKAVDSFKYSLRCSSQSYREFAQGLYKESNGLYCAPLSIFRKDMLFVQQGSQIRLRNPLPVFRTVTDAQKWKDKQATALSNVDIPNDIKNIYLSALASDYVLEVSIDGTAYLRGAMLNKATIETGNITTTLYSSTHGLVPSGKITVHTGPTRPEVEVLLLAYWI